MQENEKYIRNTEPGDSKGLKPLVILSENIMFT
jgi:hypothetical protein